MGKTISLDEIKRRVKIINPFMNILNKSLDTVISKQYFICHCNRCGGTFNELGCYINRAYNDRMSGKINDDYWCPVCSGRRCILGINDIATVRPDLIKHFVNIEDARKYTIMSNKKVMLKCPICKKSKKLALYQLCRDGFACDVCSDSISFPNKICRNLLFQLPVDEFDFEYKDDWTQGRRYDGYFKYKNVKYLLEFDGSQHYYGNKWISYEDIKQNDNLKTSLATENGFILIRIDCRNDDFLYIKNNIFQSKLNNIFNLDDLNWSLIFQNSIKNIDFEIAEYYMNHKDMLYKDIASHFYISQKLLFKALNKTAKLGLCDYSKNKAKENWKKYVLKRNGSENTCFVVYDNKNDYVGTFNSPRECKEYLDKKYMNNISRESISKALFTGELYDNFRFEYEIGLYEYHKDNKLMFNVCRSFNTNMSTKEIAKYYGISYNTVLRYLRAGHSMKLCIYRPMNYSNTRWKQAC